MQEPRRPAASDRSLRRSAALARAGRAPVALRAMVVLDRDAEDAIVAEARREALDEARMKSRRGNIRQARIREPTDQMTERSDDLGPEAPRHAFGWELEHVAQAQDAEVGEARERFLGPVEKEKRQVGKALTQMRGIEAGAHLQPARLGAREGSRAGRGRRDPARRGTTQIVAAA